MRQTAKRFSISMRVRWKKDNSTWWSQLWGRELVILIPRVHTRDLLLVLHSFRISASTDTSWICFSTSVLLTVFRTMDHDILYLIIYVSMKISQTNVCVMSGKNWKLHTVEPRKLELLRETNNSRVIWVHFSEKEI